jgi:hypothetical protein
LTKKNIKWKNMSTGHRCHHLQLKKPLQKGKSVAKSVKWKWKRILLHVLSCSKFFFSPTPDIFKFDFRGLPLYPVACLYLYDSYLII